MSLMLQLLMLPLLTTWWNNILRKTRSPPIKCHLAHSHLKVQEWFCLQRPSGQGFLVNVLHRKSGNKLGAGLLHILVAFLDAPIVKMTVSSVKMPKMWMFYIESLATNLEQVCFTSWLHFSMIPSVKMLKGTPISSWLHLDCFVFITS